MSFRNTAGSAMIVVLAGLAGCVASDPDEPVVDDELTSSAEHELTLWRNDVNGLITPGVGFWGNWMQLVFCNEGTWAIGYQIRVEASQGGGLSGDNDDTSLNSVRLLCKDPATGGTEWVSSYDGIWGSWKPSASCPNQGSYLRAARMRIESPVGSGDDTAANDVEFTCTGSLGTIHAAGAHTWGTWGNWSQCPNNTAVCGLQIRFEGIQGGGDDTAMNGMEMRCCDLPSSYCGDGVCAPGESSYSCSMDCGSPPPPPTYCGDGVCNGSETSYSCPGDCGGGGGCLIDPCDPQCISAGYICPIEQVE